MTAAGYANWGNVPFAIRIGPANLAFSQPWEEWGYLGVAEAEQYGFRVPPGSALSALGIDVPPPSTNPPSPPAAEQTALGKCETIVQDFTNATDNGPLAGIQTLSNDIYNDVLKNAAVKNALQEWSACMAKNGYSFHQPQGVFRQELQHMYAGKGPVNIGDPVSAAANKAQIAVAVTDANCAQSADLAGIYFAVQASYEQQLVNANQQALNAAVQHYRTAYQKELKHLPALLQTAKAQPFLTGKAQAGRTPVGGSCLLVWLAVVAEGYLNGPFVRAAGDAQLDGAATCRLERIEQVIGCVYRVTRGRHDQVALCETGAGGRAVLHYLADEQAVCVGQADSAAKPPGDVRRSDGDA
jgi:hypothetical protein